MQMEWWPKSGVNRCVDTIDSSFMWLAKTAWSWGFIMLYAVHTLFCTFECFDNESDSSLVGLIHTHISSQ